MTPPPLFAVWAFGSAWMLLWGFAGVIPVVIHLWSRRRQREAPWAAMDFLLAAIHKHSRRLRLEQLLLLALRTLLLVLLAVALAEPLLSGIPALSATGGNAGSVHTVLVLDASYSMSGSPEQSSYFELAKQQAAALVRQAQQGDGFTLVLLADPPAVVVGNVAFDAGDLVDEIEGLRLQHRGADLPATLEAIDEALVQAQRLPDRFARHRVYFWTDLGSSTWQESRTAECQRQIGQLANKAALRVIELGPALADNLAVTQLTANVALPTPGREVEFTAEVRNFSDLPQRRRVELLVDGRGVAQQSVSIPPQGSSNATLAHRFDVPGQHVVEARIEPDRLPLDDRRWRAVECRESVRVLCVQGRPRSADFVALALAPDATRSPAVRPQIVSENGLLERDLADFDCVVLCNVGRFGREEAAALSRFVERGGGLITILGDQVQPQSYNEQLADGTADGGLLPARLGELVGGGPHSFDPLEYRHRIVAPFRGHERAGLLTTPVWRYYRLQPAAAAATALAFGNGDPALVTRTVGYGRSVLLATAASTESIDRTSVPIVPWTALVSSPSFPPLMHEMLEFAVAGNTASHNVLVGEDLELAASGRGAETTLGLVDPDGVATRVAAAVRGRRLIVAGPDTSGVFAVEFSSDKPPRQFAVNLDTAESDPQRFDPDLLPARLETGEVEAADAPQQSSTDRPSQLFRLVLALVLVLALGESLLAWWFGRGTP